MLVNRVGDMGLILAMVCYFGSFWVFRVSSVFNMVVVSAPSSDITLICLLLFVGAVGKSAQLGLHTWLPDAMEGKCWALLSK